PRSTPPTSPCTGSYGFEHPAKAKIKPAHTAPDTIDCFVIPFTSPLTFRAQPTGRSTDNPSISGDAEASSDGKPTCGSKKMSASSFAHVQNVAERMNVPSVTIMSEPANRTI